MKKGAFFFEILRTKQIDDFLKVLSTLICNLMLSFKKIFSLKKQISVSVYAMIQKLSDKKDAQNNFIK